MIGKIYLKHTAVLVSMILYGCGGHGTSAKEIVPKIESYKAALKTMDGCNKQIEGAKELLAEAEKIYGARTFRNYLDSASREISRAEGACEKFEKYKEEAKGPEVMTKLKDSIPNLLKSALTIVENGISQQEAYKTIEQ